LNVSIVLCTANRPDDLARTLRALSAVDRPSDMSAELIIVDNRDGEQARGVLAANPPKALSSRVVHEPQRGLSHARNRGIAEARGRAILFIDDDVRPQPGWLEKMAAPLLSGSAVAVAGAVRLAPHLLRPWMTDRHRAWLASTERLHFDDPRNLIGANMGVAREVFERIAGFDTDLGAGALGFGEESLLVRQLLDAGLRIAGATDAVVEHHFAPSRLRRDSWLESARRRGEKGAYIAHHWDGRGDEGAAFGRWAAAARLLYGRALRPEDVRREEGCAEWEMLLVRRLHFWRALGELSGVPRKYRPAAMRTAEAATI
jgi:glycosyltransferase involved in cell wall biosynthesis